MPLPPDTTYDVVGIRAEAERLYNLAQADRQNVETATTADYVNSAARSRQRLAAVRGWS